MVGKRYNWHKHWTVDLAACTATHDTGLIVHFKKSDDDETAWDGSIPDGGTKWFEKIKGTMPPQDIANHVARLMREAGDAYLYQLKQRH
jgi:hypothetical protein